MAQMKYLASYSEIYDCFRIFGTNVCARISTQNFFIPTVRIASTTDQSTPNYTTSNCGQKGCRVFGSRPPPVFINIKRILESYPDGQILKELIQNAEDAGATEVSLTLDTREFPINSLRDKRLSVCQGAALTAFNDATFSDQDWENIQNFSRSEKETNPDAIGRFGVGFSSVYHLTDFAWILSRERLAVIDPRETGIFTECNEYNADVIQPGWQWNLSNELEWAEVVKNKDQFVPFPLSAERRVFNGSFFRFPLRCEGSAMSDVIYSPTDIERLFCSFMSEAEHLLLFLSSVTKVTLWKHAPPDPESKLVFSIVKTETDFKQDMKLVKTEVGGADRQTIYSEHAVIQLKTCEDDRKVTEIATELKVRPFVGIALLLRRNGKDVDVTEEDGFVHCFLPLPPEEVNKTGLPFHCHGYFALSENRRSVRLLGSDHKDKKPEWNKLLIAKLLPGAFVRIMEGLRDAGASRNPHHIIAASLPDPGRVKNQWLPLAEGVYRKITASKIFWCFTSNSWVALEDALVFPNELSESCSSALTHICQQAGLCAVVLRKSAAEAVSRFGLEVQHLSSEKVCQALRSNANCLVGLSRTQKLGLLDFVLSEIGNLTEIFGLALIPLSDGEFTTLSAHRELFSVGDTEVFRLLPGAGNRFLADDVPSSISRLIGWAQSGIVRFHIEKHFPGLLKCSVDSNEWSPETQLTQLWDFLNKHFSELSAFHGLPILPRRTMKDGRLLMKELSPDSPCLHPPSAAFNDWLELHLGIALVDVDRHKIRHSQLDNYVLTADNPRNLLRCMKSAGECAEGFRQLENVIRECWSGERVTFDWLKYELSRLDASSLTPDLREFLSRLPLFASAAESDFLLSAKVHQTTKFRKFVDGRAEEVGLTELLETLDEAKSLELLALSNDLIDRNLMHIMQMETTSVDEVFCLLNNAVVSADSNDKFTKWTIHNLRKLRDVFSCPVSQMRSEPVLRQLSNILEGWNPNSESEYLLCCELLGGLQHLPNSISEKLAVMKCVLCRGKILHTPNTIDKRSPENLCPFLCRPFYALGGGFLKRCGVLRTERTVPELANILTEISRLYGKRSLSDNHLVGVMEILMLIFNNVSASDSHFRVGDFDVFMPDKYGVMYSCESLVYDDLTGSREEQDVSNVTEPLVHCRVSREMALKFGVRTLRDLTLEKYEEEEFGQQVNLVARIRRLLEQYHSKMDIVQEFIQNAEDAGATKVLFILDERYHSKNHIFSEAWADLQGPALLIYNNAKFSDKDLEGIQNLGVGAKGSDMEKIGRYGAGFNCAYRITDCPSFLTDDSTLCVLDPQYRYVVKSRKRKPGIKYTRLDASFKKEKFTGVYHSFVVPGLDLEGGTLFRLPLRTKPLRFSDENRISSEIWTVSRLREELKSSSEEHMKFMIFLTSVKEVGFARIDRQETVQYDWQVKTVSRDLPFGFGINSFVDKLHMSARSASHKVSNPLCSVYELEITEGISKKQARWLVSQKLGFSSGSESRFSADHQDVCLLPVGGVATCLTPDKISAAMKMYEFGRSKLPMQTEGQIFCGLPIPQFSGFPVCINGHFALDSEGRKNLFTQSPLSLHQDARQKWNEQILADVVLNSYLELLRAVRRLWFDDNFESSFPQKVQNLTSFWDILPDLKKMTSTKWKDLALGFYQLLAHEELIPCLECGVDSQKISFASVGKSGTKPYFPNFTEKENFKFMVLKDLLISLGMKIVDCPLFVLDGFEGANAAVLCATPENVADFLRSAQANIGRLPCSTEKSVFMNFDSIKGCLNYILLSKKHEDQSTENNGSSEPNSAELHSSLDLDGIPLLVTADKILRLFSSRRKVFLESSDFVSLFTSHSERFVHPELYDSLKAEETLQFKRLNLEEIAELLPDTLSHQYHCRLNPDELKKDSFDSFACFWIACDGDVVTLKWLKCFWTLLSRECKEGKQKQGDEKTDLSAQLVELFGAWRLLPVKNLNSASDSLLPLSLCRYAFSQSRFDDVFGCHNSVPGIPVLRADLTGASFCFIEDDATSVAVALGFWNNSCTIGWNEFNKKESATRIFQFFEKKLPLYSSVVRTALQSLPLFQSFNGRKRIPVSDEDGANSKVFAIRDGSNVPTEGIDIWMAGQLLIKAFGGEIEKKIFSFLEIKSEIRESWLYCNYIIPQLQKLTPHSQAVHLQYLKNCLRGTTSWRVAKCNRMGLECTLVSCVRCALWKATFVEVTRGCFKRICDFKDHTVKLYQLMLADHCFLPDGFWTSLDPALSRTRSAEAYRTAEKQWLEFFQEVGLPRIVAPDEYVQFAKAVSNMSPDDEIAREKAKKLLKHFLVDSKSTQWSQPPYANERNRAAAELSQIKFIPKEPISESLLNLYPAVEFTPGFIQLSGSVCSFHKKLTWSLSATDICSVQVLPDWVDSVIDKVSLNATKRGEFLKILSVQHDVPLKSVLKHCQTIFGFLCDQKLRLIGECSGLNSAENLATLQRVCKSVYAYLKDKDQAVVAQQLEQIPFVLSEDGKFLVSAEMLVERMEGSKLRNYPPFLYEIPVAYLGFRDLFIAVGMQRTADSWHFAMFLNSIKKITHGKLDPHFSQLCECAQKAMMLSNNTDRLSTLTELSLLGTDGCIHDSSTMIFEDVVFDGPGMDCVKVLFRNRIGWQLPIFIGNEARNVEIFLSHLPKNLRPERISELVVEKVHTRSVPCRIDSCPVAKDLRDFLQSEEFLRGICRLYYYENKTTLLADGLSCEELRTTLMNVGVECFESLLSVNFSKDLNTALSTGEEEEEEQKLCMLETAEDDCTYRLCVQHGARSCPEMCPNFVGDLALQILRILPLKSQIYFERMLRCFDAPSIDRILDSGRISSIAHIIFPDLERYTELKLGQSLTPDQVSSLERNPGYLFSDGDFVGYEVTEGARLILAKVVCGPTDAESSGLLKEYTIQLSEEGTGIRVKGFDLWKFGMNKSAVSDAAVVSAEISESGPEKSLNELMKKVTQALETAFKELPLGDRRKFVKQMMFQWHPDKNLDREAIAKEVFQHLKTEVNRLERMGISSQPTDWENVFEEFQKRFFKRGGVKRKRSESSGEARNWNQPDIKSAKLYRLQAELDLEAAEKSRGGGKLGSEHLILLSYQAIEKALKSVFFSTVGAASYHQNLTVLVWELARLVDFPEQLQTLVKEFERECCSDFKQLQNPDVTTPREKFTEHQAELAISIARKLLTALQNNFVF